MFTGLVQAVGRVHELVPQKKGLRMQIAAPQEFMPGVVQGDSICVQGVCLTVVDYAQLQFAVEISQETLDCTTLGDSKHGDAVNLEKSLTLSTPIGGHLVSGHVDGLATIMAKTTQGDCICFRLRTAPSLARYIARKGSICLDGVSLTVNRVEADEFDVNIIPHTLSHTTIQFWKKAQSVNIEVDLLARYAERILQFKDA